MTLQQTLRRYPAVRRLAIPTYQTYARLVALPYREPRVLANGMPKAGTHLLMAVLGQLPKMRYSGMHLGFNEFSCGQPDVGAVDWKGLSRALTRVRPGQYLSAHFPASRRLAGILAELAYRTIVIMRDPRDVAVSVAHYAANHPFHPLHRRYTVRLTTANDRLMATIRGFPADEAGPGRGSIAERVEQYLPWIAAEHAHVCRFEDLVGSKGGGPDSNQRRAIASLATYVDRPLSEQQLDRIQGRVWSSRSATFRRGVAGDWRNNFSDEHKQAFKEVATGHLIALGYEEDDDW